MKVEAITKYKNKNFLNCMHACGYKTVNEFACKCGFSATLIGMYINFKAYPKRLSAIKRLTDALHVTYDCLFPEEYRLAVDLNLGRPTKKEIDVDMISLENLDERKAIDFVTENKVRIEQAEILYNAIDTHLTTREKEVLALLFGLDGSEKHTLEEVGKVFKLSKERIRQIEAKALRKLRQPSSTLVKDWGNYR